MAGRKPGNGSGKCKFEFGINIVDVVDVTVTVAAYVGDINTACRFPNKLVVSFSITNNKVDRDLHYSIVFNGTVAVSKDPSNTISLLRCLQRAQDV